MIFFLFLNENLCCGYLLEAPLRGASNENQQHMFSLRNKKRYRHFSNEKSALSVAMYLDTPSYLFFKQAVKPYYSYGLRLDFGDR